MRRRLGTIGLALALAGCSGEPTNRPQGPEQEPPASDAATAGPTTEADLVAPLSRFEGPLPGAEAKLALREAARRFPAGSEATVDGLKVELSRAHRVVANGKPAIAVHVRIANVSSDRRTEHAPVGLNVVDEAHDDVGNRYEALGIFPTEAGLPADAIGEKVLEPGETTESVWFFPAPVDAATELRLIAYRIEEQAAAWPLRLPVSSIAEAPQP